MEKLTEKEIQKAIQRKATMALVMRDMASVYEPMGIRLQEDTEMGRFYDDVVSGLCEMLVNKIVESHDQKELINAIGYVISGALQSGMVIALLSVNDFTELKKRIETASEKVALDFKF